MRIIEHIKKYFRGWITNCKKESAEKAEAKCKFAAEMELGIREFNGEIYLAHHGIPVVNVRHLNTDIIDVLMASRESLVSYKKKYN